MTAIDSPAQTLYAERVLRTMGAIKALLAAGTVTHCQVGHFVRAPRKITDQHASGLTSHLLYGSMPRMKTLEHLEAFVAQYTP